MRIPGAYRAVTNVLEWADSEEWNERREAVIEAHLGDLLNDLELLPQELIERLGEHAGLVFTFIYEDFFGAPFRDGDGETTVVDAYLERRGWLEKPPATRYLRSLRDSIPSLFEVQEVSPGRSVTLRDLLCKTGPRLIDEESASETLAQWDCIVARVVPAGRKLCFTGAILNFPRELAETCISEFEQQLKVVTREVRAAQKKDRRKGAADVEVPDAELPGFLLASTWAAPFFTDLYVEWMLDRLAAPSPELRNTDGEALVLSTVRFPIEGAESEVAAALDAVEELDRARADTLQWGWLGGPLASSSRARKASAPPEETALSLGQLEISDGALLLRVNSVERAERGRDLLASRLGSLLGTPLTSHEGPAPGLEDVAEAGPQAGAQPEIPPDQLRSIIGAQMEQHYRQVLDEEIPIFGNRTPRHAAKLKTVRPKVVGWLKQIENTEARAAAQQGREPLDFGWLWEELKIERPGGKA